MCRYGVLSAKASIGFHSELGLESTQVNWSTFLTLGYFIPAVAEAPQNSGRFQSLPCVDPEHSATPPPPHHPRDWNAERPEIENLCSATRGSNQCAWLWKIRV